MFVKSVWKWLLFQTVCIWCSANCSSSAYGVQVGDRSKCISWDPLCFQFLVRGDKQFIIFIISDLSEHKMVCLLYDAQEFTIKMKQ